MSTSPTTPRPKLGSERVIISAPMSFAGAWQRGMRIFHRGGVWTVLAILLLLVWLPAVLCWYLLFGVLLVPYRLLRRGSRKRKRQALQHRELLDAVQKRDEG